MRRWGVSTSLWRLKENWRMGCIFFQFKLGGCIFFHVVYFSTPMLYILPDSEAKKRVRGAPGAHSRRVTTGRLTPRATTTRPPPWTNYTATRPTTLRHRGAHQRAPKLSRRRETSRTLAQPSWNALSCMTLSGPSFLSWGGVRDMASCAVGSTMMRGLMSVMVWMIIIQRDAQVESLSSIHRKMLSKNHAVACYYRFWVEWGSRWGEFDIRQRAQSTLYRKSKVISTPKILLSVFLCTIHTRCPNFCSQVSILLKISLMHGGGDLSYLV